MNDAGTYVNVLQAIQALVTLAVGFCSIYALLRKNPALDTIVREEIGKLYEENKRDRASTDNVIRDHESRISRLEGKCSINKNAKF